MNINVAQNWLWSLRSCWINAENKSFGRTFSHLELRLKCGWQSDKIQYPWLFDCIGYTEFLLQFFTLPGQFWLLFWKFIWVNTQIHLQIKVLRDISEGVWKDVINWTLYLVWIWCNFPGWHSVWHWESCRFILPTWSKSSILLLPLGHSIRYRLTSWITYR